MLAQLLQGAAGFGTELFGILHVGEDGLSDIPVAKAVCQIPAVTDCFHDAHYIGEPYIRAGDTFPFDSFPGADGTDLLLYGFDKHNIHQGIKKPHIAGF